MATGTQDGATAVDDAMGRTRPEPLAGVLSAGLRAAELVVWIAAGLIAVAAIASAAAYAGLVGDGWGETVRAETPMPAAFAMLEFLRVGVLVAGLIMIVRALRGVFAELSAGDPFTPANAVRLRTIALAAAGIEGARVLLALIARALAGPDSVALSGGLAHVFHPTAWVLALVLVVLADVFREGARLREDAKLTV